MLNHTIYIQFYLGTVDNLNCFGNLGRLFHGKSWRGQGCKGRSEGFPGNHQVRIIIITINLLIHSINTIQDFSRIICLSEFFPGHSQSTLMKVNSLKGIQKLLKNWRYLQTKVSDHKLKLEMQSYSTIRTTFLSFVVSYFSCKYSDVSLMISDRIQRAF